MKDYEAYIGMSGSMIVRTIHEWDEGGTDQDNPLVLKHFGIKKLPSLNQARAYFKKENGGRLYMSDDELEKLRKEKREKQ